MATKKGTTRSVFHDLFIEKEAINLEIRSRLMDEIIDRIKKEKWTQAKAAKHLGVTQSRISELFNSRIDLFTIDRLVKMLAPLNLSVEMKFKKLRRQKEKAA